MTETEWLACTDPQPMLVAVWERLSDRKFRLFGCACCRRIWHLLTDPRSRRAVEAEEQHAEGLIGAAELRVARKAAADLPGAGMAVPSGRYCQAQHPASTAAWATFAAAGHDRLTRWEAEKQAQADLLRCVAGNPFRRVSPAPAWRTALVTAMAQAIHQERQFHELPILADAIAESGCEDGEILAHLRNPGAHAPGCGVLDYILGKS
jgi:hypothetical protein